MSLVSTVQRCTVIPCNEIRRVLAGKICRFGNLPASLSRISRNSPSRNSWSSLRNLSKRARGTIVIECPKSCENQKYFWFERFGSTKINLVSFRNRSRPPTKSKKKTNVEKKGKMATLYFNLGQRNQPGEVVAFTTGNCCSRRNSCNGESRSTETPRKNVFAPSSFVFILCGRLSRSGQKFVAIWPEICRLLTLRPPKETARVVILELEECPKYLERDSLGNNRFKIVANSWTLNSSISKVFNDVSFP